MPVVEIAFQFVKRSALADADVVPTQSNFDESIIDGVVYKTPISSAVRVPVHLVSRANKLVIPVLTPEPPNGI